MSVRMLIIVGPHGVRTLTVDSDGVRGIRATSFFYLKVELHGPSDTVITRQSQETRHEKER